MIKLKDLLTESASNDFNIKWMKNDFLLLTTEVGNMISLRVTNKDGFEDVEKKGRDYIIHYKNDEYTLDEFLKLREIKKMLKSKVSDIEKIIKSLKKSLPYADRGYRSEEAKIRKKEEALKIIKKYT